MPVTTTISDPTSHKPAEVRDGALVVTERRTAPTAAEIKAVQLFTALLTTDAGATGMNVDGSSTAEEYHIRANSNDDDTIISIKSIRLVFHSENMIITNTQSRRFGPVTAPGLTNGLKLTVAQAGVETEMFLSPVKVIGDFYRYAGGGIVGINSAIVSDSAAITSAIDFLMILLIFPVPVVLFPGTLDSITMLIQDDLTGITLFETQAYGSQEAL